MLIEFKQSKKTFEQPVDEFHLVIDTRQNDSKKFQI